MALYKGREVQITSVEPDSVGKVSVIRTPDSSEDSLAGKTERVSKSDLVLTDKEQSDIVKQDQDSLKARQDGYKTIKGEKDKQDKQTKADADAKKAREDAKNKRLGVNPTPATPVTQPATGIN